VNHGKLCLLNNTDIEKNQMSQKKFNIKVWFEQKMFNNFIQSHHFPRRPFSFHNIIYFIFLKNNNNRVPLDTFKKHSNFHIFFKFVFTKFKV
jgi:hypothetical protein